MVLVPITAIMAFGDQLGVAHSLKYYNYDFQGQLDFVYYFVSFYVFLNVAAFSVYIIIIRTNIMSMFLPQINPRTLSKQTALVSAVLLLIILTASYFLKDRIQVAISFTSGIFGGLILFYLPTL